jgi:two-component system CheB/CheR fusion protein
MGEARINRYGALLLGEDLSGEAGAGLRPMGHSLRLFRGDRELGPDEHPLQLAVRSGEPLTSFEGQLLRSDGERRDVMIISTPLRHEGGAVRGGIAAIVDISERKHAEERQQVLLYELQHRVKNIIATVSALAARTLREGATPREFVEAFQGRLRGMASTHDLLSRGNWRGTQLREVIETALRGHVALDGGAVGVHGPKMLMSANATATLGMVLYELATNAVKYGALSAPGGHLEVTWGIVGAAPADRVQLNWTESGGKKAVADMAAGFGLNFIKRSVEYELQGKAAMAPAPGGLHWTLDFPVTQNVQPP